MILSLCLVLLQHGALVHAFVHLHGDDEHSHETGFEAWHALDERCETCAAYAACGSGPPGSHWLRVAGSAAEVLAAEPAAVHARAATAYAARAPPVPV